MISQQTRNRTSRLYFVTLLIYHAKYQAGRSTSWNQIARRNISNLRYADDITLMAEIKEKLKSLLVRVKEESETAGLKLNIQIDEEKITTVRDFIFLGSKIIVDGDYSHEIKRCFLLGRIAMTNLDSILKSKDITLLTTMVSIVKAVVFPVVMYECEIWTIRKAECQKIDAFEL